MLRQIPLLMLSILLAMPLSACGQRDIGGSDTVLARVGKRDITVAQFFRHLALLSEGNDQGWSSERGRLLSALVDRELLYRAASASGLDRDREVRRRSEELKRELVVSAYLQREVAGRIRVDGRDVERYYREHPAEFLTSAADGPGSSYIRPFHQVRDEIRRRIFQETYRKNMAELLQRLRRDTGVHINQALLDRLPIPAPQAEPTLH